MSVTQVFALVLLSPLLMAGVYLLIGKFIELEEEKYFSNLLHATYHKLKVPKAKSEEHLKSASFAIRLLVLFLLSDDERESLAGDLIEEHSEFQSRFRADVWLYIQILKSALPLICKNLKNRLAYYFGERIR
jgi:hypothetical protein